jgi:4-alpha-glucanotransferase
LGLFNSRNRRHVAIAIRADGRRVQVPAEDLGLVDVSLFGLLRSFELGIERVLVLITGSRRETGRRDKR